MAVSCRRNVATMDSSEKQRFRNAVFTHYERGLYQKYIDFHGFLDSNIKCNG